MGRTRLYVTNAERQRAFQQKKKEHNLQVQITEAEKNNQPKQVIDFPALVSKWFFAKTLREVKEAYEDYKHMYMVLGTNILFQEIEHYLLDEMPLNHGITVGQIDQFLTVTEDKIECPICHYFYSHLESNGCPECNLRLHDYKKWLQYMKEFKEFD